MAPYEIEDKLVIAVASSALFDLSESDEAYREKGTEGYRKYQRENEENTLNRGAAFPLVKRLLSLNENSTEPSSVEVILLSRNDPDTGLRVFNSIEEWNLPITRAAFLSGGNPFEYLDAFNACLFLSADANSVKDAVMNGAPAGLVFPTEFTDDESDLQLRIAFDFDGVIADDSAEIVNQEQNLKAFQESERTRALEPLSKGPLYTFFTEVARIQKREREASKGNPEYKSRIKIALVTARNAPAHKRVVTRLREWGIEVDETFFLGGIEKARILKVFKPHIFFDDKELHIQDASQFVPSAHIPFGIANRASTAFGHKPNQESKGHKFQRIMDWGKRLARIQ